MLTVVIPTKNRAPFISRLLRYYADVQCPFPIIIGDSSGEEHLEEVKRAIEAVGSRLKITHIVDQSFNDAGQAVGWQRDNFLRNLINYVQTPYVAFYADDDFAVVNNLGSAIDFLEANKDYSFVCGEAILFGLKNGLAHGEISGTRRYHQREISQEKPSQRLFDLYSNYAVFEYGVSRTEQKKYHWNKVFELPVDNAIGELIGCSLTVIQGKIKKMDKLFMVRQGHTLQVSGGLRDIFDWMKDDVFPKGYARLSEVITHELVSLEPALTLEQTQELLKKCFWLYLAKQLPRRWKTKYSERGTRELKQWEGIFQALRIARSFLPQGKLSLPALLRPSSAYHRDFIPIYNIVTNYSSALAKK